MIRGIFKVITDPSVRRDWRYLALLKIGRYLMPQYRFQWPHLGWWRDQSFNDYLKHFDQNDQDSDRRWMIGQLTKLVREAPGDTAECGVLAGSSSYLISRAFPDRTHFMFDSFEGLSTPEAIDGDRWHDGDLGCELEAARAKLTGCANVSFHKGWIPERFADVESRKFCFVHIDVQLYEPTRDSLQFFYPRMSDGGIIVCDDYGFTNCPGPRRAVDEFLEDKPEQMITLSCGSGFFFKESHHS